MKAFKGFIYEDDKIFASYRNFITGRTGQIEITEEEADAISKWAKDNSLIQDALPHWSASKRELLLSGMNDEEWDETFSEEEEE